MRSRVRMLALLLALPAGALLAEGITRAFGITTFPAPEVHGATVGNCPDPRLGFDNIPGGVQRVVYRDRSGAVLHDVEARVNSQGFRGPVVPEEKPEGVFRIACIGDSHTFGYGVGEGESWPFVFAAKLRSRPDGARFEVMNCGVNGYDAMQSLALLELRVEHFHPDLVLFGFFVNDTAIRGLPAPSEQERPTLIMRLSDPRRKGLVHWLRERSRFVDLIADGVFNRDSFEYFGRSRSELFGDTFEGWIRVRAELQRTHDRLEAEGVGFVVLLVPFMVDEGGHAASTRALAGVAAFCQSRSIPCIDLQPAFDGMDFSRLRVHPCDFHAGAEAHRILGEEADRQLSGSRFLEAKAR